VAGRLPLPSAIPLSYSSVVPLPPFPYETYTPPRLASPWKELVPMNASSSSAEEQCQTLARKLSSQALLVEFTPDVSILTADTLCLPRDLQILLSRFS
jgi:hypothetical protein